MIDPCENLGGDTDGDGVCDNDDNCPESPNADQADADENGIGDVCDSLIDPCENLGGDTDGDGVCDNDDNCPETPNADQADADGNGIGDVCDSVIDPCENLGGDTDGDGVCDNDDNCPETPNADQADADGNGIGDVCDSAVEIECDLLSINTGNETIIISGLDASPIVHLQIFTSTWSPIYSCSTDCNPTETIDVSEGDYIVIIKLYTDTWQQICETFQTISVTADEFDPCENLGGDSDADGICDAEDNCPNNPNPNQTDSNENGIGDACEVIVVDCDDMGGDTDEDGICDFIDPCPEDPLDACEITGPCASSGTDTSEEFIERISIGSINNTSGNDNGYGDYTSINTDLVMSETYTITLVPGFQSTAFQEHWTVLLDLSGDGDFNDPGEILLSTSSDVTITEEISIPSNISLGEMYLRVSMMKGAAAPECGEFQYGEVEDYMVNIVEAACIVGTSCDDGNDCTIDDVLDANCNCIGQNQDTDGDSICDVEDNCPDTANPDQVDNDGNGIGDACDSPVGPGPCEDIIVTGAAGTISANGYNYPIVFVKVYDSNWNQLHDSGMLQNNEPQVFENLPAGSYIVSVQTYDAGFNSICNELYYPSWTESNFIAGEEVFDFQAHKNGRQVSILWLTNSEARNDHFIVERSSDGVNFQSILEVNSITDNNGAYNYFESDANPFLGESFYRIGKVHKDETVQYSRIKKVVFDLDLNETAVFPNPTSNEVYIDLQQFEGRKVAITIFNPLGQKMDFKSFEAIDPSPIRFDLEKYTSGVYTLYINIDGTKNFARKIIVSKL